MEKFVLIWRLETEGQVYRDDASRDSLNTSRDIEKKKKKKKKKEKEGKKLVFYWEGVWTIIHWILTSIRMVIEFLECAE